ncbi:MAG: ABC transporter permease [Ardenticatenaceae bacterium]|nr:ABC transporter permease [Ardenticatenaceae bacterium]
MNRRTFLLSLAPLLASGFAIVAAFLIGAVFLQLLGKDSLRAYQMLVSRGLGSRFGVTETLIKMAPLLLVSAGLLIALKAGVWNIGIDGQFLVGASMVGIVAARLAGTMAPAPMLVISALVGFLGGAAWGLIPALLKVRYGLNEIITTIMMNYVAIYLTSWLVKGPFKDPTVVPPQTPVIPKAFRLPPIPFTRIHIGLLVGLLAVLLVAYLFRNTVPGFQLWVLGQNRRAAIHAGLPVDRLTVLALLLSAGFAGLAGANDVLGVKGLFQGEWNPAYGLTGFALVFLARLNGLWVIPFAYFFSFLFFGGEMMARSANIPAYFVDMLEGLMLVFFAVAVYLERASAGRERRRLAGAEGA